MAVSVLYAAKGFRELAAKLQAEPPLVVPAVRKAQRKIAATGAKMLRARAATLTGRLKKSIRPKSSNRGLFAGVTFDPIASQGRGKGEGFRSAWAFDNSTKFRPRRTGVTTRWVRGVPPMLEAPALAEIAAAAQEVEAAWRA